MTEIRRSSETDVPFPHGWNSGLCYVEVLDGEVNWVKARGEVREAVRRAIAGSSRLYCAWPGRWATDLFLVDDLDAAAEALGA